MSTEVEGNRRTEAVLRFYADLAEDLRGPLAALAGLTEVLAAQAGTEAAGTQTDVRAILAGLRRLTDDAGAAANLALGRLELRRAPVDLVALVAGVLPVDVELAGAEPVVVSGDRARLEQVVEALLATATLASRVSRVTVEAQSGWANVRITTAAQLPFPVIRGLFDPFSRPVGVTDGLGLTLARALAEAHGGHIGADAGETTTLWLRLPLTA